MILVDRDDGKEGQPGRLHEREDDLRHPESVSGPHSRYDEFDLYCEVRFYRRR